MTMTDIERTNLIYRALNWATGAVLALCLYIATDALEALRELDSKVDTHETRISILEVKPGENQTAATDSENEKGRQSRL